MMESFDFRLTITKTDARLFYEVFLFSCAEGIIQRVDKKDKEGICRIKY